MKWTAEKEPPPNQFHGMTFTFKCVEKAITSLDDEGDTTEQSKLVYRSYTHLVLTYNHIVKVNKNNFFMFSALKVIDLRYNKLTVIEHDLFTFNRVLKYINLSHNNIKYFNLDLTYLSLLSKLYIQHNSIETLQENIFKSYLNIKNNLDISHNHISCGCSNKWIRRLSNISANITIHLSDKCTHDIHKEVGVMCFILNKKCTTIIQEQVCIPGN